MKREPVKPLARKTWMWLGIIAVVGWSLPAAAGTETNAASPFAPTIANKTSAPTNAPSGMAWIPGGEFSMGCTAPNDGICTMATIGSVSDAQPIHRVYVDGF